jgi:hexosaminidase
MRSPLMQERGIMIDIGRKFYSVTFFKRLLDYMSELQMNSLQIHFSENEGFRLACDTIPEIVSKKHLSKKEMKEIIVYANERNIEIVPEFDSPGHLYRLIQCHPEFQIEYINDSELFPANRALDINNKSGVQIVKKIIREYLELFDSSKYFHLGADEYIDFEKLDNYPRFKKTALKKYNDETRQYDLFIDYINDLAQLIEENGKVARIWNDGIYKMNLASRSQLKTSIQISYWTRHNKNMAPVDTFIDKGHQVINFNDNFFYFVLGEGAGYKYPVAKKISENWNITLFPENQSVNLESMANVLGVYFAIWSDYPDALTEDEVFDMIKSPLKAQQEIIWKNKVD